MKNLAQTTLKVNSVYTFLCGASFVTGADKLSGSLGVNDVAAVLGVGAFLITVSAAMAATAFIKPFRKMLAWLLTVGDIGYVAASIAVVFLGKLNETGNIVVLSVAAIVMVLVILQIRGLIRE